MVGLLRLLAVLWPLAEIVVLVAVAEWFGIGWVLLALLGGVIAGVLVIRVLGAASLAELGAALSRREPPAGALLRGACVLLAGVLLILPGLIGDGVAVLLLVPPLRAGLLAMLWRGARRGADRPTVIEGEYREVPVEHDTRRIEHPPTEDERNP
jgi:UPF0716 protein FxsA